MTALELSQIIGRYRLRHQNEAMLQAAIEKVLKENGVLFEREERLNEKDRPDFMVWNLAECCGQTRCISGPFCKPHAQQGVAIEVKIKGSPSEICRQLHRYAQHERVSEILLITTKAKHCNVTQEFNGKPIVSLWVGGTAL